MKPPGRRIVLFTVAANSNAACCERFPATEFNAVAQLLQASGDAVFSRLSIHNLTPNYKSAPVYEKWEPG